MKGRFDQALAEAFYFEESDVIANRAGRMSKRQEEQFRSIAAQTRKSGPFVIKMMIVAAIGVVGFTVFAAKQGGIQVNEILLPLAIVVPIMVIIGLVANRRTVARSARMAQGAPVQLAEGRLEIDRHPAKWWENSSRTFGWQVSIGGVAFRLMPEQAEAFRDGESYRIYYCDFKMARLTFLTAERSV